MARLFSFFVILFLLPLAVAQTQWREFRSDSDGFSIQLPATPKITARRIENTDATQTFFMIELKQNVYFVSVIQLGEGKGPKAPDQTYFAQLLKSYADGSNTTTRSSRMITWAGHPAIEGITDATDGAHLVDITAAGDRVYMVVFAGSKGEETSPEAARMRDSFKLLGN